MNIEKLIHNHYCTDIYHLPNFLTTTYDAIFLSNIGHYCSDVNVFFNYINYLKDFYLNNGGSIYYGYLYKHEVYSVEHAIRGISTIFENNFDSKNFIDIINNTEVLNISSAEYPDTSKDSVLVFRK